MRCTSFALCLTLAACAAPAVEQGSSPGSDLTPAVAEANARLGRATSSDGLGVAYEVRGAGSPTLVFVHGWMCERAHWRDALEAFAGEHRVVALDLGGHGASGRDREEWTMDALSRDLQAVLEALDVRDAVLVGHSVGGPVSLMAGLRTPERVLGVVGVDTFHDAGMRQESGELAKYFEADFAGTMENWLAAEEYKGASASTLERLSAAIPRMNGDLGIELLRSFTGIRVGELLAEVPFPVRAINASPDVEGMVGTKLIENRTFDPDFDVEYVRGVGHFLMMDDPTAFHAALRRALAAFAGDGPLLPQ